MLIKTKAKTILFAGDTLFLYFKISYNDLKRWQIKQIRNKIRYSVFIFFLIIVVPTAGLTGARALFPRTLVQPDVI
jgi:hypothetical protein